MKFDNNPNKELVTYIKLVYGKDSALAGVPDINQRKQIAANEVGIEVNSDDEKVRKLILEFMREQNHYKYSLLESRKELYWETLEVLREPLKKSTDDDKRLKNVKLKGDVNDLCSKLVLEIESLAEGIYGEEFKEEAQKTVTSFEQRLKKNK